MEQDRLTKWKFLIMIAVIFSIAVTLRVYQDFEKQQRMLEGEILSLQSDIDNLLNISMEDLYAQYATVRTLYMNRPSVVEALKQRQRGTLYDLTEADYRALRRQNPELFVMHWFDPRNVTIVRMHKPESYGDDLSAIRPIVAQANRTKEDLRAFEVGKNGITYRITLPLCTGETCLGVLEFGIKPAYFIQRICDAMEVKAEILVRSDLLRHLSYDTDFTTVDGYTVISKDPFFDTMIELAGITDESGYSFVERDGRTFALMPRFFLPDIYGNEAARILIAKDVTDAVARYHAALAYENLLSFILLAGSLLIVYVVFTRYERALGENYRELRGAVDSLTQSRERHRLAQKIAHVGNWELEHDSGTLYWSDEVYRIFEVEPSLFNPSQECFVQLVHPDDRERVLEVYDASVRRRSNYAVIHRLLTPKGTVKYVSEKGQHAYDAKGNIVKTVGTVQDITQIRLLEEKVYTDPLTGLFNRRLINITLEKELSSAVRHETPLSLAICDIDHFKDVNDTYGHDAGDKVLIALAESLKAAFREGDSVGRWGGEEFVVILPDTGRDDAWKLMERYRRRIEKQEFRVEDGQHLNLTLSVGISTTRYGNKRTDSEMLFKEADEALYQAKIEGRNRVIAYRPAVLGNYVI